MKTDYITIAQLYSVDPIDLEELKKFHFYPGAMLPCSRPHAIKPIDQVTVVHPPEGGYPE